MFCLGYILKQSAVSTKICFANETFSICSNFLFHNFPSFNRKYGKANINSEDPCSYVLNSFRAQNNV